MKKIILLIVIALSIALLLAYLIQLDPGYVRISIGHWLIESNLWVLLALNITLLAIIYITLAFIRGSANISRAIKRFLGQSAKERAREATEKGILAFLEGNWHSAKRLLSRAAKHNSKPIINYLAAAHACSELGEQKEADNLLKKAYELNGESEFAIGIAQTRIQIQQGQLEPALATLLRLKKQEEHHPFVLKQLKTIYLRLEDWQQLVKLIPVLRKELKENEAELKELECLSWKKLFQQKTDEILNRNQEEMATEILASLWKSVPDKLYADTDLVKTYAEQLLRVRQNEEAEALLRITLNKHWDSELVLMYGKVRGSNPAEQLTHAENWLKPRSKDAGLLLTLGRLALQNELWGKALDYFEASKALQANRETLAELCRLKLRMNKQLENAAPLIEELLTLSDLPKLPLPKH